MSLNIGITCTNCAMSDTNMHDQTKWFFNVHVRLEYKDIVNVTTESLNKVHQWPTII